MLIGSTAMWPCRLPTTGGPFGDPCPPPPLPTAQPTSDGGHLRAPDISAKVPRATRQPFALHNWTATWTDLRGSMSPADGFQAERTALIALYQSKLHAKLALQLPVAKSGVTVIFIPKPSEEIASTSCCHSLRHFCRPSSSPYAFRHSLKM